MGLDRTVRFPTAQTPSWEAIAQQLARVGEPSPIRMIDGLPAFPDEKPEPGWKELRIGTASGMVTLRRSSGILTCVIWGNSNEGLSLSWAKVLWACAVAGDGLIETPNGAIVAEEFARTNGFSPT